MVKNVLEIESTEIMKKIKEKDIDLYMQFINIYKKVEPLLNIRISQVFKYYTLHDSNHSIRIIKYMGNIVPDINKLNAFELVMLAYSALLHDIGMAASEEEIRRIKNNELIYDEIAYDSILKKYNNNHEEAIQDYIRRVHALRSAEYIKKNLRSELVIPNMINTTFEDELSIICESHTEDFTWIKQNLSKVSEKGEFTFNPQFCAVILRLADILDFDSQRTPPILYHSIAPKGFSKDEWIQHFSIENINKIKLSDNGYKLIELHGRCSSPLIHRKVLSYIEWINNEINNANDLTRGFSNTHRILIHPKVFDFIKSEGYTIADMKFNVNYNQITSLLMGDNLYGEKKLGLRELVQNSIDACKVKKEILDSKMEFGEEQYTGIIKVVLDESKNEVVIKDNGIGMDIHILKNYFLKLGASFYNSEDYLLKGYFYKPIGNYGIGFLACFMFSDIVKVRTKHMNDSLLYEVELSKFDEYVCINHNTEYKSQGTEVILKYDQFMKVWETPTMVEQFLTKHFLSEDVKIEYINKDEKTIIEIQNTIYNPNEKNQINLSVYLNEIEAYVTIIKNFEDMFDEKLNDLTYMGDPLYYDGSTLNPLDEEIEIIKLEDIVSSFHSIYVLNFPIIEEEENLNKVLEVIEDVKEAFELYNTKYNPNYITIISNIELMEDAIVGDMDSDSEILADLYLSAFEDYGHAKYAGTFIDKEQKIVFGTPGSNLYLSVKKEENNRWMRNNIGEVYVRNVFVGNIDLDILFKLEKLIIKNLKVNVKNREVKPDVTRNNLNPEDYKLLKEAIYLAICFYIYEQLSNENEKSILLGYIREYHQHENKFLKVKYENLLFSS